MITDKGRCHHGEFTLNKGCPQCITERLAGELKAKLETEETKRQLVKVRYFSETTGELSEREYTYYSEEPLKVEDIVIVPIRDTTGKAKVTAIDIAESEIEAFKDKVKTILAGSVEKEKPMREAESFEEYQAQCANAAEEEERAHASADAAAIADLEAKEQEEHDHDVASTAIITIAPDTDERVIALYNEGLKLRDYALSRVIKSDADMIPATEELSIIAKLKKTIEEKRKEYVDPIRHHLDAVNNIFKDFTAPLNEADQMNRDKIKAYRTEVERKRAEAEDINRQAIELAKKQAELSGTGEFTVDITPVEVPEVRRRVFTGLGSTSTQKIYKWEVENLMLVPREYMMVNAALIGSVVKSSKGSISIPGVRIYVEDTIRVNAR